MRLVLLLLAACGRIGFAPLSDGGPGGGGGDGPGTGGDGTQVMGTTVTLSLTGACPAVAWNGSELGVAWRDTGPQVHFSTYDASGARLTGPVVVGATLTNSSCPAIVWTGAQYLVAIPAGTLNRADLFIASIQNGTPSTPVNITNDSGDSTVPSLAYDGTNVLVGWLDQTGSKYTTMAMALSATGTPTSAEVTVSTLQSDNGPPTVFATASGYAMTWAATGGPRVRALDTSATPSGVESPLGGSATNAVPAAWTGSDVIAAWTMFAGTTISTARFSTAGAIASGPATFDGKRPYAPALVWTGSGARVLYYETSGLVEYWVAELDATGALVSQAPLANAGTMSASSLTWTGSQLVAAIDSTNGAYLHLLP
jgi:hypothetical protein